MATKNPLGKQKYWYNGAASHIIKTKVNVNVGNQTYWYNGQTQGYLTGIIYVAKPRCYSVLIGF